MLNFVDNFLNKITMYRLVLYVLFCLILAAAILSIFHFLPFSPFALLYSTLVLLIVSWVTNSLFAYFFRVEANVESVFITALILALIITPPSAGKYLSILPFLFLAAILSQASKYILKFKHKHIFNPVAFAVALTSLTINQYASWWVGSASMLIFVGISGLLVIKKVRRFDAVAVFILAALITILAFTGLNNTGAQMTRAVINSPLIFFAAIMFTEPLTMPPSLSGRMAYGILVGLLFAPPFHLGSFYLSPELALLAGNIFSFLISPKGRLVLRLKEKRPAGEGVYEFVFESNRPLSFKAGQYMEWTLGHKNPDTRGNRRYFTLASSPTEKNTLLGVKFYEQPSSFKQSLLAMNPGDMITAGQLAGEFTLPSDAKQKLVFIAGGIGITPFRSMIKYLIDKNEKRPIIVLYSNRTAEEIAYKDILLEAEKFLNIKTINTLTEQNKIPEGWQGQKGYINGEMIAKEVPDYKERTFYISGSHAMVTSFKETLANLGISPGKIKTDFFPGLV